MKLLLSVVILILCLGKIYAENPGMVADVKLPLIEKIRDKYFTTIFSQFGHQTVPDMQTGDLKVSGITVDLTNGASGNLKIGFDQANNALDIEVDNTQVRVHVNWQYKKSIVSVSGDATITGPVSPLTLNLGFTTKAEGSYFIPQVAVNAFNANFNKGSFNLDFHCSHCPGEVEKWISDALKDQLIDSVSSAINSQVPSQLNSVGNQVLDKSYPRSMTIFNNIDIATALSSTILVQSDHLELPLDSTVFLHEEGYNRPGDAPEIPTYNPSDPGEVQMFMSSYLLSTLTTALNKGAQSYKMTAMGIEYDISLDPAIGQSTFGFEEGDFDMNISPSITIPAFGIGVQLTADAKLSPIISQGDDKNMLSITPKIKGLSMSALKLVYAGSTYDISFVSSYFNSIMQYVLNAIAIPTIPIAKKPAMPLHVTGSELDFHAAYTEFGIVFEFGKHF